MFVTIWSSNVAEDPAILVGRVLSGKIYFQELGKVLHQFDLCGLIKWSYIPAKMTSFTFLKIGSDLILENI